MTLCAGYTCSPQKQTKKALPSTYLSESFPSNSPIVSTSAGGIALVAISCQSTDALRLLTGVPICVPLPCAPVYSTTPWRAQILSLGGGLLVNLREGRCSRPPTASDRGSGHSARRRGRGGFSHTRYWLGVAGRRRRARASVAQGATRWSQEAGHVDSTKRDSQCKYAVGNLGRAFRPESSIHGLTLPVRVHCQQVVTAHHHTVHWTVRGFQSPCHSASCIQSKSADTK